jgi:predicted amidophosphoribosyltransferase
VHVSAATGIPCEEILVKDPGSPLQHELPAHRKCIDIRGKIRPKTLTDARTVLLIDDTGISGCTMRECARVLKENGTVTVYGFAVGRGIDRKRLEYLEKDDARHV